MAPFLHVNLHVFEGVSEIEHKGFPSLTWLKVLGHCEDVLHAVRDAREDNSFRDLDALVHTKPTQIMDKPKLQALILPFCLPRRLCGYNRSAHTLPLLWLRLEAIPANMQHFPSVTTALSLHGAL